MSESLSLDIPWMDEVQYNHESVVYYIDFETIVKIPSQCWTTKRFILTQKIYVLESPMDVISFSKKKEIYSNILRNGYNSLYIEYPDKSVELIGQNYVIQKMLPWLESGVMLQKF